MRSRAPASAAVARDEVDPSGEGGGGDPAPAPALADVAAGDAPVRQLGQALLVGGPALDPGHLVRRAELAPAEALVAVEDECGVRGAGTHPLQLPLAMEVCRGVLDASLGMEADAPAAAEDAAVPLDERRERWPRRLVV